MPFFMQNKLSLRMQKQQLIFVFLWMSFFGSSQNQMTSAVDSLYREDQIYFGVMYNAIISAPEALAQNSFSPGFTLGIIRDFPINKTRNIAVGLGLGYTIDSYSQNLKIAPNSSGNLDYEFVSNTSFQKNRLSYHTLDIPLEFRWRTSTAERYKFWRIYAGFKASYITTSKAYFESPTETITHKNLDLKQWQFGLTLSAGYNNWNGYLYYGITPLFEDVNIENSDLEIKTLKIGLMFYFL